VDFRKKNLLAQRFKYLTRGNFHGVSANWLAKQCDALFPRVEDFVSDISCPVKIQSEDVSVGKKLFASVIAEKSGANFGRNFDCEEGLASFLYAYIVNAKPSVIIETGVANGITTNVIMRALEQTGGVLHSFDVDPKTINAYVGTGNWNFHLLKGNFENELRSAASKIGSVDLWIHDSNHGYQWQSLEYDLAAESLKQKGIIISDDIDASTAWGLASNSRFAKSFGIFDNRKFFGVATI